MIGGRVSGNKGLLLGPRDLLILEWRRSGCLLIDVLGTIIPRGLLTSGLNCLPTKNFFGFTYPEVRVSRMKDSFRLDSHSTLHTLHEINSRRVYSTLTEEEHPSSRKRTFNDVERIDVSLCGSTRLLPVYRSPCTTVLEGGHGHEKCSCTYPPRRTTQVDLSWDEFLCWRFI